MRRIKALLCALLLAFLTALPALAIPPQCTVSNGVCISTYTDQEGPEVLLSINCNDGATWSGYIINDIETFCTPT